MLPANVGTGIVHWQAGVAIIDGDDADQNPDMVHPTGTVTFTPSISHVQNVNAVPNPITITLAPIVGVLDEEGYLCTPVSATDRTPMYRGVRLVATDDPDLSVKNWNYSVAYRLGVVNGATPTIPAHPLAVPEGENIDLSLFAPVPSSPPVGTPQALALLAKAEEAATLAATNSVAALQVVARADAGEFKGADGPAGLDGSNVLPTDEGIAQAIVTPASATNTALSAAIGEALPAPKTPLETTGVLSTWDEESSFWDSLVAKSPRVKVESVGSTVGGRPVRMVSIGYPAAPPAPETLDANSLLIVGFQHGGEPASREAIMAVARDLAFSDSPNVLAYLRDHPLRILPTVNADSVDTGRYENANGVNINRDHLAVAEPEGKAVHNAIRRIRPYLILDAHERNAPGEDFSVVAGRYAGAHPAVSQVISEVYVATTKAVASTGSAVSEYGGSSQEPRTLHISGALALAPTTVFETNSNGQPVSKRVADQVTGMMALIEYHRTNAGRVEAAVEALRSGPPSTAYLQASNSVTPAPTGYRMTAAQWTQVSDAFGIHGLQVTLDGTDRIVTLDQISGWLVPNLLDSTASWPIGTGARLSTPIPGYVVPESRKSVSAQPRTYIKVFGEDALGAVPSGITSMMSGTLEIVEVEGSTYGRGIKFNGSPVGVAITEALADPLIGDSEILYRWKSSPLPNIHGPSAFLRMTGAYPNHGGYRGGYRHVGSPLPASGGAQLVKITNGAAAVLAANTRIPLFEVSTWYLSRFRVQGELLTVTIWKESNPTPVFDQNFILDSSYTDGWAGIGTEGSIGFVVDWMVHTTGGGRASRTQATGGSSDQPAPEPEPEPVSGSTYAKVFSENQIGETPTGVTSLLTGAATVQAVEGATDGRALQLVNVGDPHGFAITAAMSDPALANSEVLMRWKTGKGKNHGPTIWHRLIDSAGSYDAYQLSYAHASTVGHARVAKRTGGVYGGLQNAELPVLAVDTWHLMRGRISGSQIMLKIWPESAQEPAAWNATVTDTAFLSGQTGVGQVSIGTGIWVDWFVHATGGLTAVAPA